MLYAKLGKRDELRVVCGACGNGLAWIVEGDFGRAESTAADPAPAVPSRRVYRHVLIPEGWFPDTGGVWRPSQRARRQFRRGLPPRNRRPPKFEVKVLKEDRGDPDARDELGRRRSGFVLTVLPAEMVCLYCDMRQTLDAETLRAEPFMPPVDQHLMVGNGPMVRLGLYPGSVPMAYRRVRDAKTKRWTAKFVYTWLSYGPYLEFGRQALGTQRSMPVDPGPSAVAESEEPNID
jgi:hypothetical protein